MQNLKKAQLVLEDGTIFEGTSFGYEQSVSGEVVFYTAMTGYPESLTDPSYKGQILVPTYPMIGNYGVPVDTKQDDLPAFFESDKIHCTALIISDYSFEYSHWNSQKKSRAMVKRSEGTGTFWYRYPGFDEKITRTRSYVGQNRFCRTGCRFL